MTTVKTANGFYENAVNDSNYHIHKADYFYDRETGRNVGLVDRGFYGASYYDPMYTWFLGPESALKARRVLRGSRICMIRNYALEGSITATGYCIEIIRRYLRRYYKNQLFTDWRRDGLFEIVNTVIDSRASVFRLHHISSEAVFKRFEVIPRRWRGEFFEVLWNNKIYHMEKDAYRICKQLHNHRIKLDKYIGDSQCQK